MTTNPADSVREALLPCPFCGSDDAHVIGIAATNERSVICYACGGETSHKATAEEAVAAWNKRPRIAALTGAAPVAHGTKDHGIEAASRETFVPCDCGCGRSCCAMCGNDVGFLSHAPAKAREVTDADVERALGALNRRIIDGRRFWSEEDRALMRAALATFAEGA